MRFGSNSMSELQGVRAELVVASTETLIYVADNGFDFSVFDGLRTEAEQRKNIRRGVSWTMNSLHLPQDDGWAHAVDLVPYLDGRLVWDAEHILDLDERSDLQKRIDRTFHLIQTGMKASAEKHGFVIAWGYDMWGKDKPHFQVG